MRIITIIICLFVALGSYGQGKIVRKTPPKTAVATTPKKKPKAQQRKAPTRSLPSGIVNGHEAVNLGLSVRWASCNIGATIGNPCGSYFMQGDLEPKETVPFKEEFNKDTEILRGITKIAGNPKYDQCTAYWGSPWRLPSQKECQELIDKCEWKLQDSGVKVIGPNGNSIFLPLAGFLLSTNDNPQLYKQGFYMTSDYNSKNIHCLNFGLTSVGTLFVSECDFCGRKTSTATIRAVTK